MSESNIMVLVLMGYAVFMSTVFIICKTVEHCYFLRKNNREVDDKFIEYLDSLVEANKVLAIEEKDLSEVE